VAVLLQLSGWVAADKCMQVAMEVTGLALANAAYIIYKDHAQATKPPCGAVGTAWRVRAPLSFFRSS
jgi:hypothetical protein